MVQVMALIAHIDRTHSGAVRWVDLNATFVELEIELNQLEEGVSSGNRSRSVGSTGSDEMGGPTPRRRQARSSVDGRSETSGWQSTRSMSGRVDSVIA